MKKREECEGRLADEAKATRNLISPGRGGEKKWIRSERKREKKSSLNPSAVTTPAVSLISGMRDEGWRCEWRSSGGRLTLCCLRALEQFLPPARSPRLTGALLLRLSGGSAEMLLAPSGSTDLFEQQMLSNFLEFPLFPPPLISPPA